jgi:hypothetical protein
MHPRSLPAHRLRAALVLAVCGLTACTAPQPSSLATNRLGPFPTGLPLITVSPSVVPGMGQEFTGSVPFLDRQMALPPGVWKVARSQAVGTKTIGLVGALLTLVQAEGPILQGLVMFSGNARPLPHGFALNQLCLMSDVLWNDIRQAVPQGEQDCAVINFERPALWRGRPMTAPLMNELDLLNVQPPNFTVSLGVVEANQNWSMTETVIVNPDLEGITPDLSTQRAQSAWTAFRLPADPAKQRLIEKLKQRAAKLRADLRREIQTPAPYLPHTNLTPA